MSHRVAEYLARAFQQNFQRLESTPDLHRIECADSQGGTLAHRIHSTILYVHPERYPLSVVQPPRSMRHAIARVAAILQTLTARGVPSAQINIVIEML